MSIFAYQEGHPDFVALLMVLVLVAVVAVMVLRKYLAVRKGLLQEVSVTVEEVAPAAADLTPLINFLFSEQSTQ
jgi:hypothetical protein